MKAKVHLCIRFFARLTSSIRVLIFSRLRTSSCAPVPFCRFLPLMLLLGIW